MLTKDTDKKLFLLDAYALIFRAYYAFAKNPRINSKGFNTSAVFGFTNALLDVIKNEQPTHLAVCFDPPEPPGRTKTFEGYKANRDATPEDIKHSVPFIMQLLQGMNIPIYMESGYEADDVVGTLAKQAEKEGFSTYMMTPDKDFGQLVSENIFMFKPARMGNSAEVWGIPEILEKFGLTRVEQVIDTLGLMGDAVDNIPGVPGVGPKKAQQLIEQFDSVEGIYENLDKLKGKLKENLENNKEQAFMSKLLATIILDVPCTFNAEDCKMSEPNKEELRELFNELEFRRMAERILGDAPVVQAIKPDSEQFSLFGGGAEEKAEPSFATIETTDHDYQLVEGQEAIDQLIADLQKQKVICFDTETSQLNPLLAELVGLSFSYEKGKGFWVPAPKDRTEAQALVAQFAPVLTNPNIIKVAQNLKYDFHILMNYGLEVKAPWHDTMINHYIQEPDSNRRSMDILAENLLDYQPVSITKLIGKKGKNQKSMADLDPASITDYAAEDADITLQLFHKLTPDLEKANGTKVFEEVDMPLVPVLARMEREGINLDTDFLNQYSQDLGKELIGIEQEIYDHAGSEFKISSPKQVGEVLFDRLKVIEKPKKTKTGQYATNEEVLRQLAGKHPIIDKILEFREVAKLKSTYVDSLPKLVNPNTKHIHTSFNQVVAATGRLSSDNPNLQNIPVRSERGKKIRAAFIPRNEEYTLLAADYSQVELRIIAALSGDEGMISAFQNGQDIHASTAAKVYDLPIEEVTRELRSNAKTVNFGIIYGISAFGLSQRIDISRKEAKNIIDSYFEKFPGIKTYMDKSIENAREHGYVETILGRRRYLRDIHSANATVRGFAERNAINSPIQGSAADIIKLAMIDVDQKLREGNWKSKMLLQVHDELVFDAHKDEVDKLTALVKSSMENAYKMEVPLEVDANTGSNWLEAH